VHLASPVCVSKPVAEFNIGLEAKDFSFLQNVHTGSGARQSSVFNGYRCSFPGVMRPGREVNHPLISCVQVKNGWSYTPAPKYDFAVWTGKLYILPVLTFKPREVL